MNKDLLRALAVLESGHCWPGLSRKDQFHMPEKRIKVWVQKFLDRPRLVLQWHDPITGSRSRPARSTRPRSPSQAKGEVCATLDLSSTRFSARLLRAR